MGFWDLDDGSSAKDTAGEYKEQGGNFDPIPDGSNVIAEITEAKWDRPRNGTEEFISLKWVVLEPEAYAKRVVFQKLWVEDLDPSVVNQKGAEKAKEKRANSLRNLAAIDKIFGGKLSKVDRRPNSDDLTMALTGQPAMIKVNVWTARNQQGQETSGNWVCWVGEVKGNTVKIEAVKEKPKSQSQGRGNDFDDEIPF